MKLIKKISVVLAFLFFTNLTFGQTWLTDIKTAKATAKTEQKNILMVFAGSDWCRPCMQLKKQVLETTPFKEYAANNLVLVYLDFPARKKNRLSKAQTKHNEALAEKYNQSGAFPLVIMLDARGKTLGKTGYDKKSSPVEYVEKLKQISVAQSSTP